MSENTPAPNETPSETPPTPSEMPPLTREAVLGELMKLAFANMYDYLRVEGGKATVDLSRLTRDQGAAITDVTITTRQERPKEGNPPAEIVNVRFNLADKRQALLALGRYLGLFDDEREEPEPGAGRPDFADPKARLELAREILFLIADAKNSAAAATSNGYPTPPR